MASSRNSHRPSLLATTLITALLGVSGAARAAVGIATCTNQQIVVEPKSMEVDSRNNNAVLRDVIITQCDMRIQAAEARVTGGLNFENSRWTISGDVRINAEGGSLKSDKAVVSFRDNLISQATITGSPAEFEQQRKDGGVSRGHAGTIDYETASGTVVFTQDAFLSFGRNELTGKQLVYNIKTQSFQGQTRDNPVRTGNDRIRIVIQPKDKDPKKDPKNAEPEKKP